MALMLHRCAQRMLDAAAVEAANRLELIERDANGGARTSAMRPGSAKTSCARRATSRSERTAGKATASPRCRRASIRCGPPAASRRSPRAASSRAFVERVSADEDRARVALEKRQVGAVAADGNLDREAAGRDAPASARETSDDLP